ncbi:MAG: FKBP-type peptidyl-prolyl cis-trans isomerase [Halohasta sp.]
MSDEQAEAEAAEADESVDAEPEADNDEPEGLQRGNFVKLDYTIRTTDDEDVVDTTSLEVAEEAGLDTEQHEFEPRTIIIGEGHVFESVDDALVGSEVGDEGSVLISPEEAFGEYDPDQVRTISADKIDEDDRYPGASVQIDGQHGHIETIIGGRARVNFNHPLAGEELEYEYEILDEVEDRTEKAEGLLAMYLQHAPPVWIETDEVEEELPVDPDEDDEDGEEDEDAEPEFETQVVEKETLYVESTPQLTMNQQWLMSKGQIAQDIIAKIGVDRVVVQEILDGSGGGMFGGMGGMGGLGGGDIEEALDDVDLDDVDIDADELAEELEDDA